MFENTDFSQVSFIDSKDQKKSEDKTPEIEDQTTEKDLKNENKSEKNFKCQICNKAFPEKWRLKRHELKTHGLKVHEEKMLYQCPFCDTKIKLEHNLKIHIKHKHKEAVEPLKNQGQQVHEKKKHGKKNKNVHDFPNFEKKHINIEHCSKIPVEKYENPIKNMKTVHEDQDSKAVHENQNSKRSEPIIGIQDATIDSTC